MSPRIVAFAALVAPIGLATSVGALDMIYVSHFSLYYPEIGLGEPSGLAADPDGSGFWIVSDETPTVFRLEAEGNIGAFIGRDERMSDLEGVATDPARGRLLAVSERLGSILAVALEPPHRIMAVKLSELSGFEGIATHLSDLKNGLEGIDVDTRTGVIFLLKEKDPRLLIGISPNLREVVSVTNFDGKLPDGEDVSGLAFDAARNGFWIVSDTGNTVHFLPRDTGLPKSIDLYWLDKDRRHRLENAEGVALSPDGRMVFVLSDDAKHSRLVQYRIMD